MPHSQTTRDEKNNYVVVTLFETYLARFILENPRFYKDIYCKLIDRIHSLVEENPKTNKILSGFLQDKPKDFDLSRYMFMVFSRINSSYPGHESIELLKSNFYLLAANYFIKIIADELLNPIKQPTKMACDSPFAQASRFAGFFSPPSSGYRSPSNPARCAQLFDESNRGVVLIEVDNEDMVAEEDSTLDIGIVSRQWVSSELSDYFDEPVYSARFNYQPKESSYVAQWLRRRHLPVISGASGSTEMLFTRVLPLLVLSAEEQKMLLFSQACSMVANGHHSLFEAMIVAEYFGQELCDTQSLLEFYLQCIPEQICTDPAFIAFLDDASIKSLLLDMPLHDELTDVLTAEPVVLSSP